MFFLNCAYAIITKNKMLSGLKFCPFNANLNVFKCILGLMCMCLLQIPHNKLMKKGHKKVSLMASLNLDELPAIMPAETFMSRPIFNSLWSRPAGAGVTKSRKDGRLSDVALLYLLTVSSFVV